VRARLTRADPEDVWMAMRPCGAPFWHELPEAERARLEAFADEAILHAAARIERDGFNAGVDAALDEVERADGGPDTALLNAINALRKGDLEEQSALRQAQGERGVPL
jgi:hypothetical protein